MNIIINGKNIDVFTIRAVHIKEINSDVMKKINSEYDDSEEAQSLGIVGYWSDEHDQIMNTVLNDRNAVVIYNKDKEIGFTGGNYYGDAIIIETRDDVIVSSVLYDKKSAAKQYEKLNKYIDKTRRGILNITI